MEHKKELLGKLESNKVRTEITINKKKRKLQQIDRLIEAANLLSDDEIAKYGISFDGEFNELYSTKTEAICIQIIIADNTVYRIFNDLTGKIFHFNDEVQAIEKFIKELGKYSK